MQNCIKDVSDWMSVNKLKLNEEKTEIIFVNPLKNSLDYYFQDILLNNETIIVSDHVKNLGFYIDSDLSFHCHVNNLCKILHWKLRRISKMRRYLTHDATVQLVVATVFAQSDYCNGLLFGASKQLIDRLQSIQNHAARIVYKSVNGIRLNHCLSICIGYPYHIG